MDLSGSGAEWAVAKWSGRSLLTPVPAFQASSPQDLRLFYEKNKTLVLYLDAGWCAAWAQGASAS